MVLCKCGCGKEIIKKPWHKNINIQYIHNHHQKGKSKYMSEETKKKISQTLMGNIPWNKGKTNCVSEIGKQNISKANKNRSPPNKGIFGIKIGEKASNWKGGLSFEPYCSKFNKVLKEKIKQRDNYQCQYPNCLCPQLESLLLYHKGLVIHHIHYDKPNCDPDLITLCTKHNGIVNGKRDYHEELLMKILKKEEK